MLFRSSGGRWGIAIGGGASAAFNGELTSTFQGGITNSGVIAGGLQGIVLGGQVELRVGAERYLAKVTQTFADVRAGDILVYEDSYRSLSIAINRGDAAATLHLARDAEVRIAPR